MTGGTPPGRSRGRLADEVYDTLLGQLMSLRIEPGSRVTIDVLARELGVSQTPIRDALNRMEAEGLVVRVPHAGYRIPPQITRHRFEDMLEIRLLLEPAAARRSAERASPEQVADLIGFSHVANFQSAFKRWVGQTPAQFRKRRSLERGPDENRDPLQHAAIATQDAAQLLQLRSRFASG